MSTQSIVSIIMPVYNSGKSAIFSINSVVSQTYSNWELIIIDDCSSDNSIDLIESYFLNNPRIHIIKNNRNVGPLVSRNRGISIAKGIYIAFLDQDDLWTRDKLEIQIIYMQENLIDFSYTQFRCFRISPEYSSGLVKPPPIYNLNSLLTDTGIALSSVIYNCDKSGKVYFKDVKPFTEFYLYLRILSIFNCGYQVPYDLLRYRLSDNSMSSNKLNMAKLVWSNYCSFGFGPILTTYFFMNYVIRASLRRLRLSTIYILRSFRSVKISN